jgi:tRNA pseudouridine38-40 synthase
MTNYKLTLCYDGSRYRGWQRQGNCENSIQALVERALSRLLEQEIEVAGSGRTDAGVHARRQVCSLRADTPLTPEELLARLRAVLPEDVGALALEDAPPRFHARLSCTEKTYVYRIWNSETPNVFERRFLWPVPEELDVEAMRQAAALLCGRHDFSAFCSLKRMKKSAVRELRRLELRREGDELHANFKLSSSGEGVRLYDPDGNVLTWVDGYVASNRNSYIGTDPASYGDTTTGLEAAGIKLPSSGYISGLGYSEKCAWAFIPDTASGAETTHVTDRVSSNTGVNVLYVGGSYSAHGNCGMFYFNANYDASSTYGDLGSRLLYQP